jgi:hypothetical protein
VQKGSLRRFLRFLPENSRISTGKITFCVHRKKGRLFPQKKDFFTTELKVALSPQKKRLLTNDKFYSPYVYIKKGDPF